MNIELLFNKKNCVKCNNSIIKEGDLYVFCQKCLNYMSREPFNFTTIRVCFASAQEPSQHISIDKDLCMMKYRYGERLISLPFSIINESTNVRDLIDKSKSYATRYMNLKSFW